MTAMTRKTFEVDGDTRVIVEYDARAFRLTGKDGSVSIPMRMLHLIAKTMEMAMEAPRIGRCGDGIGQCGRRPHSR